MGKFEKIFKKVIAEKKDIEFDKEFKIKKEEKEEELDEEMLEIKNRYPLIRVIWQDIFSFSRLSINEIKENIDEYKIYKSEVGYLVHEDEDAVIVIHDLDLGNGSDNYGSYILRPIIVSIEYLEEAEGKK